MKALGKSIDKSPAAVLAGANNIRSLYKVNELPSQGDNLNWIQIQPKAAK